jgi:hypothetical protein
VIILGEVIGAVYRLVDRLSRWEYLIPWLLILATLCGPQEVLK